jgi:hypothetical protein
MASLPQPAWLTLCEALRFVMDFSGAERAPAGAALRRALRDNLVAARGRCESYTGHDTVTDIGDFTWEGASVDWEKGVFAIPANSYGAKHQFESVAVNTATLRRWLEWRPASEREIEGRASSPTRGRTPTFDWDEFWAEVACKVAADDLPNREGAEGWKTQADFERYMAEWCARRWKREPSESEIRKRLTRLMQHERKRG